MKKIFLATLLSLFAVVAMAQSRPTFIVSAGYQGANISVNEKDAGNKMKSGFRVGVAADINVYNFGTGVLSVQPGLFYSTKGAKQSESRESFGKKYSYSSIENLGYIELPILANVRFGVTPDVSVFVNAGPYLAYGVNSSIKVTGDANGDKESIETGKKLFKEDGIFKPFDAGIQVGAGGEYKNILLTVGGQFGLANMNKIAESKIKATNTTFFVTLGYRF